MNLLGRGENEKSKFFLPISILGGLFLSSCLPPSNNPVSQSGGSLVPIAPYLGVWNLIEIGDEPTDTGLSLEVIEDAGTYEAHVSNGTKTTVDTFQITEVGGRIIVSIEHRENNWNIMEAVLESQGNRLVLRSMDKIRLKEAIESDSLPGKIIAWTERDKLVRITATGAELRTYIANESNLFVDLWKFEKAQ